MEEGKEKGVFDGEKACLLVKELRKSFESGKTRSYKWRISQLEAIAMMIQEREKDIIEAVYKDLSKPQLEAYISEVSRIKTACSEAIKALHQWMKPEKVKTGITTYPSSAEIVSEPLGVVLVISTWNFPFMISLEPVIGAIAAGNAVVLKPSEVAPASSALLADLVENYLDNSSVRVIEGGVPEATALLEQKWDKILYTGNARVGRIVMAAATKHLTPVILELGGKCPALVDSNLNLQVAVRRLIAGKWAINSGQACVSVDYIITLKEFAPTLINAMKEELEQFFGKDQIKSKDMSRIVSPSHFSRLSKLLDDDKVSDKIVLRGQIDENQLKIAPTIILDAPDDSLVMQEEIFGPIMPIVTVDKIEDGFDIIKSKPKPLAAYLFTNNEQLKKSFVENISSGGMLINDTVLHVVTAGLPFGGVGESGMGCYHGKFSFDGFSHKKGVLYRSFNAWFGSSNSNKHKSISSNYGTGRRNSAPLDEPSSSSSSSSSSWSSSLLLNQYHASSSVVFRVHGNVYPVGFYNVTVNIGHPPRPYYLDIDTGSDLTWLQCDAPCTHCTQTPHPLYRPSNDLVACRDPMCASLHQNEVYECEQPHQCDYEVEYADQYSSLGVLVNDVYLLNFTNGNQLRVRMALGCGYDQLFQDHSYHPLDGMLGLGRGRSSLVSQLNSQGLVRNVFGHCLSSQGGGYIYFGDVFDSSRLTWTPMSSTHYKHYSAGPAELLLGGKRTGIGNLNAVFDTGSSYTYFNSMAYQAAISWLEKELAGKPIKQSHDDETLPQCWHGRRPFRSIHEVRKYFKPMSLTFAGGRSKAQFEIPPEAYLIISNMGNVCLGILNGSEVGMGDLNLIGDISMQDKVMAFDNEKIMIGWALADCDRVPKSRHANI
ncbi:hypothetical protein PIB30_015493 [Stylosanthes scabra]|uniref:Peptidase A1 domain-containing protein n=1 Tax=Stylosanthes scabra TaxID=79078 RepID=A0ABU6X6Z6_9FABA|nr:hypothetical protein [Stylosanthes scabra]